LDVIVEEDGVYAALVAVSLIKVEKFLIPNSANKIYTKTTMRKT